MTQEYDAKRVFTAVLLFIAAIILIVYVLPLVFGQVEVTQSQTTNTNTNNCQGLPSVCSSSVFMKLKGSTVKLTEKHRAVLIHYCKEKCHTYRIADNGTIQKVN